ncbi:Bug family tripartite tricarboxylate transporter substrate binding protein [Rhodoplanes sp. Z2-YC6860]|uniref:Bug family tripartite tricarboxylate transporter substrate binding protein n=1 Tax=Rhodoplanes sp. Z2-YC6860 TaxID=674703 RepID=UPI00078BBAFF|nr:tripartite tricarboxylate transporter substrate binding protein [Rhodoplanes sp. Z2-YC6860]AMN39621.1 extra-cytoplasmic solute receptor protein [Rhodoplanes sp. Z2-YC6860]
MSRLNRRGLLASAAMGLAATISGQAAAQSSSYPERPIRLIVPFAPGGVDDVIARLWGEQMASVLGTVVVENRAGASGMIGASEVARAAPDGYTLLAGNTSTLILNPLTAANPSYDAAKDFAPVTILAESPLSIAVHPSVPATNINELVAYIKANRGKVSYGSPGTGSITQLAGELFKQVVNAPDVTHIPYKGGGPAMADLMSGHIPLLLVAITSNVLSLHRAGKIRIVTVFRTKPLAVLPDVDPAATYDPQLVAAIFTGVFAPAATPDPVIQRLARAVTALGERKSFIDQLLAAGFDPVLNSPDEAQRFVSDQRGRISPLLKSLGFNVP